MDNMPLGRLAEGDGALTSAREMVRSTAIPGLVENRFCTVTSYAMIILKWIYFRRTAITSFGRLADECIAGRVNAYNLRGELPTYCVAGATLNHCTTKHGSAII